MRPLATIAIGLAEIMLHRSALSMRRSAEGFALRLGLVALCAALGCAAGAFFLGALYDVTASAWGTVPAKLVLGSVLAAGALGGSLALLVTRLRDRRLIRRL